MALDETVTPPDMDKSDFDKLHKWTMPYANTCYATGADILRGDPVYAESWDKVRSGGGICEAEYQRLHDVFFPKVGAPLDPVPPTPSGDPPPVVLNPAPVQDAQPSDPPPAPVDTDQPPPKMSKRVR